MTRRHLLALLGAAAVGARSTLTPRPPTSRDDSAEEFTRQFFEHGVLTPGQVRAMEDMTPEGLTPLHVRFTGNTVAFRAGFK